MSLYDDIRKVAEQRQFRTGGTNARFREEFIRRNMENPGAFYQNYGSELNNTPQTEQLAQTATVATPTPTEGDTFTYAGKDSGGGYYSTDNNVSSNVGIGTGGLLGNNPHTGQVVGMGLGLLGAPMSNVLGQAISGTPQTMESAVRGTAFNYGANALANAIGLPSGIPAGLVANAVMGKAPSMEDLALTALSRTSLGPLAALYGIGKNINQGMAMEHARQGKYGLAPQNTWGAPTIGTTVSGWFGGPTNEMKDEQGTGLMATPSNIGLGFSVPGATVSSTNPTMGLGMGITPGKTAQLSWANTIMGTGPQATSLEDLYGALYGVDPATETWGGTNTWGGWGVGGDSGDSGVGGATDDGQGTGGGFGVGSVGGSGEGEASDGLGY